MGKVSKSRLRHIITGYAFISVWVIGFVVFSLYPLINSFTLSLNKVNIGASGIQSTYIGSKNYGELFTLDVEFIQALIKYFQQIIVSVPLVIILSLVLAILLNSKIKGQTVFRAIFFLPVIIISGPVMEILTKNKIFETMITFDNSGIFKILETNDVEWLATTVVFLVTNIGNLLWYTGVPILIFIVGLQKIPKDMYEASFIDGASPWQSFWKLTLPSLVGFILINIIFTVIQISTMDNQPIIKIITNRMFDLKYGFGYASSVAWVYFLVLLVVIGLFVLLTLIPGLKNRKGGK